MASKTDQYIVVADELAGLPTSNTVLENDGQIVLLDRSSVCGGNSTKVTDMEDLADLFVPDVLKRSEEA